MGNSGSERSMKTAKDYLIGIIKEELEPVFETRREVGFDELTGMVIAGVERFKETIRLLTIYETDKDLFRRDLYGVVQKNQPGMFIFDSKRSVLVRSYTDPEKVDDYMKTDPKMPEPGQYRLTGPKN